MNFSQGRLSEYFSGVGVKRLSAVDVVTSNSSNQHEITGRSKWRSILGNEERKFKRGTGFPAKYIWLADEQDAITVEGHVSWYNSRNGKNRSAEWRLYYQANIVTECMRERDTLYLALDYSGSLLFIVTPSESSIQKQLNWLFNVDDRGQPNLFDLKTKELDQRLIDFTVGYILDEIGVTIQNPDESLFERIANKFRGKMPATKELAALTQKHFGGVDARRAPDETIIRLMEFEERLFRALEKPALAARLSEGFGTGDDVDIEGFLQLSKSTLNRRKSRAGQALENHLEWIFQENSIRFARSVETENRNRVDFLFPGSAEYRDLDFPSSKLCMLGVKTTLKDRWRQVLPEADRIHRKHLFTLQPSISQNQTTQITAAGIKLVIPAAIHSTYNPSQQAELLDLSRFMATLAKSA